MNPAIIQMSTNMTDINIIELSITIKNSLEDRKPVKIPALSGIEFKKLMGALKK